MKSLLFLYYYYYYYLALLVTLRQGNVPVCFAYSSAIGRMTKNSLEGRISIRPPVSRRSETNVACADVQRRRHSYSLAQITSMKSSSRGGSGEEPESSAVPSSPPLVSCSDSETISSSPPAPSPLTRPLGSLAPEGTFEASYKGNAADDQVASSTTSAPPTTSLSHSLLEDHKPVGGKERVSTTDDSNNLLVSSTGVESVSLSPPAPSPFLQGPLGYLAPPGAFENAGAGGSGNGEEMSQDKSLTAPAPVAHVAPPNMSESSARSSDDKDDDDDDDDDGTGNESSKTPSTGASVQPETPKSAVSAATHVGVPKQQQQRQMIMKGTTFAENMKQFNSVPVPRKDNLRSSLPNDDDNNNKNEFAASLLVVATRRKGQNKTDSGNEKSRPQAKDRGGNDFFAMRRNAFSSGQKQMATTSCYTHPSGSEASVTVPNADFTSNSQMQSERLRMPNPHRRRRRRRRPREPLLTPIGPETMPSVALEMVSWKGRPSAGSPKRGAGSQWNELSSPSERESIPDIKDDAGSAAASRQGGSSPQNRLSLEHTRASSVPQLVNEIGPKPLSAAASDMVSWKGKASTSNMTSGLWTNSPLTAKGQETKGNESVTRNNETSSNPTHAQPEHTINMPIKASFEPKQSSKNGPETLSPAGFNVDLGKQGTSISNGTIGLLATEERRDGPKRQTKAVSPPTGKVGDIFAYRMNAFLADHQSSSNRHPKLVYCFGAETVPLYSPRQVSWKSNALEVDYKVIDDATRQLRQKPPYPPPSS